MNPVQFVSAGAGSGKTYRLTQIISEALESGDARASGIVATTYTIKAAAELRERARARLLESGRVDLASAIGQARIGTINSVCGHLLSRFCFELGMSPDQVVLDGLQALRLQKTTFDSALDEDGVAELVALTSRLALEDDKWDAPITSVFNAARENVISASDLRAMAAANADEMLSSWPALVTNIDHKAAMLSVLEEAQAAVEALVAERNAANLKSFAYFDKTRFKLRDLHQSLRGEDWSWNTWVSMTRFEEGALVNPLLVPVAEAARSYQVDPQFHSDVRRYLALIFNLAADCLEAYRLAKDKLGAVDFVDQGVELLQALQQEEVRETLAGELDLVVVDEFQDSSPLQLSIFVELAKLAKRSVWVGDPKQAVYSFRGTDPTLITNIVASIESWGGTLGESLTQSRRSTPNLVSLCNEVFTPAFARQGLQADQVRLSPVREEVTPGHVSLHNWSFESTKLENDHVGIGVAVRALFADGHQVRDRKTDSLRPVEAGDIAILCRTNKEIAMAVKSLSRCGIPAASGRPGLLKTPEVLFVVACLRRLLEPRDTVASALIVSLSSGTDHALWLRGRLEFLAGGAEVKPSQWMVSGDRRHAILERLEDLRPRLRALTPSEALRMAKAESHIAELASRWSTSPQEAATRIANVEALVAMASTYEDECVSARRPATVGGLLQWLRASAAAETDARAVVSEGAVSVLTHHAAKGLEWPVVVLTGLASGTRTPLWQQARARTNGDFDALHPLMGRFIHFWPYPYGKQKDLAPAVAAEASPRGVEMAKAGAEESLRLLYVSMTRARDTLVSVTTTRVKTEPVKWLDEAKAAGLLVGESETFTLSDGQTITRRYRHWSKAECTVAIETLPEALNWFSKGRSAQLPNLWLQPSGAKGGHYEVVESQSIPERIKIEGSVDMEMLGQALHLCIAKAGAHGSLSGEQAGNILRRWGVGSAVKQADVVSKVQEFLVWVQKRWPGGVVHVEIPLEVSRLDGMRLRGRIDLLVETPKGWVLIDHKSNPGGTARDEALVQKYGPQLDAYADAVEQATKRPVLEKWLFLPVSARAVRLQANHACEIVQPDLAT